MTRPQSTHLVWKEQYGYGFFVKPGSAPLTMFAHTGGVDGYQSYMRVDLSKGVYYVILSNAGEQGLPVMKNLEATIQMAYERD
jgi:CubicO group peptidase (beta-lactamase class C family)